MVSTEGFYAVPVSIFPVGGNECLALDRRDGSVRQVDMLAARALGCCEGVRPLDAHAAAMLRAGVSANPAAIAKAVDRLLALDLLRRWTWRPPDDHASAEPGQIDTVAIVTADRPKMVARCLDAIIRHCRRWDHAPRLLVVDGSRHEADATRQAACQAATEAPGRVEYLGQTEAARLRRALAGEHLPADVLDFALTPGEIGANRNLALLSTVGERVLMVDDDVLLEPWALEDAKDGVALVGHEDPHEWRFFKTRQEALEAAYHVDVDLLAAHGSLLGRNLTDILTCGEPDLATACQHMIAAATHPHDRAICVTFVGLAGDAAIYCPGRLLFARGSLQRQLHGSATALRTALTSREVHRIVRRLSVTHDSACMSYCVGFDNRSMLPPFLPVARNEDGIFSVMLTSIDSTALFAHLPYGVVHDSARESAYTDDDAIRSASENRISTMVRSLLQPPSVPRVGDRSCLLTNVAQSLAAATLQSPSTLAVSFGAATLSSHCRDMAAADALSSVDERPHFRAAVNKYRNALVSSALHGRFMTANDLHVSPIPPGISAEQAIIGALRRLLDNWATMWCVAARWRGVTPSIAATDAVAPRREAG
jgi:hypothetical protein